MIKKEKRRENIILTISQIISVLIFAIYLIPKFIIALDPQLNQTYIETPESVSLIVVPLEAVYTVGDIVPVQIAVHLGNQAINAVGVELYFPPDKVEVIKSEHQGSFCTLWPEDTFDNIKGAINYSCGLPNPGFSDIYGIAGTFYIKFKEAGYVNFTLGENCQVLANDGFGTNILESTFNAGYNIVDYGTVEISQENVSDIFQKDEVIQDILTPIKVNSSTHPDQSKWYNETSLHLSWEQPEDIYSYSYTLDHNIDTIPDSTQFFNSTSLDYTNLEDGIWYFHIMKHNETISGPVTHFKIQIDTDPPKNLTVTDIFKTENKNEWELTLSAEDTNGISHYEVILEDSETYIVQDEFTIQLKNIYSNNLIITAYDLSGNSTTIDYAVPIEEPDTLWEFLNYYAGLALKFLKEL